MYVTRSVSQFLLLVTVVSVNGRKIIDLTHVFDKDAPKWPLTAFTNDTDFTYYNMKTLATHYVGPIWIAIKTVEFYEHQGTHIDAPFHTGGPNQQKLQDIPPERLIGPGVVIDVKKKVKDAPDYAVTVQDIEDHEAEHGKIPVNAIVMMNSGWDKHYPNPNLIFGTQNLADSDTFHFPGFGIEACRLLHERQVSVVGVDTPSTDPAIETGTIPCHGLLQGDNVPLLEYVANLDKVPARGTTMVLGAIKIRDGTGGPTRIFAIIDEHGDHHDNSSASTTAALSSIACFMLGLTYLFQ